MTLPTRYTILRNVENNINLKIEFADEKPIQVWTLIDEDKFNEIGLKHNVSAFIEDRGHDWLWDKGTLRFYGHSGGHGDKHDLVIVLEK